MGKTRVLIVDDHPLMREALRDIIEADENYEIAGEAVNGSQGVAMAVENNPDVVLLDLSLPDMDGIQVMREILEARPGTRVFIITSAEQDEKALEAVRAGAAGYMTKDASPSHIRYGLGEVAAGIRFIPPEIGEKLARALQQEGKSSGPLTGREKDILRLVGEGRTNREISGQLALSEGTVRVHISNIIRKLELKNRSQVALYAMKNKQGG